MTRIGHVAEVWRYPVKSMGGQRLEHAALDAHGLVGDRRFAFESTAAPRGKPLLASRERTGMLRYTAFLTSDEAVFPDVNPPHGSTVSLDAPALLHDLQSELHAEGAPTLTLRHSPARPLTDVRPVSLVSQATLAQLSRELSRWIDPQRFRSNLILALDPPAFAEPFAEDSLTGRTLRLGHVVLKVAERIPRCRIVSLDPETTAADPSLLGHLAQHHAGRLGVYATVVSAGSLTVGSSVDLL